jgi:hypothetical protein
MRNRVPLLTAALVTLSFSAPVWLSAQSDEAPAPIVDPELERLRVAMVDALTTYRGRIQKAVNEVAPRDGQTPPLSGSGVIRWDRRSMDIPEVTMTFQRQDLSYSVPEVTMHTRRFSFDVPEFYMGREQVGCNPVVVVDGWEIRTRCDPIYMDVPKTRMVTQHFSTDIPEVAMRLQRVVLSVPESRITMRRIEWDWPEFVNDCSAINSEACREERARHAERAQETQRRITEVMASARQQGFDEAGTHVTAFYRYQRDKLTRQLAAMGPVLQATVAQMQATLNLLEAQGAGASPQAEATRAAALRVTTEMTGAMKTLQDAIVKLSENERAVIESLADGPATITTTPGAEQAVTNSGTLAGFIPEDVTGR